MKKSSARRQTASGGLLFDSISNPLINLYHSENGSESAIHDNRHNGCCNHDAADCRQKRTLGIQSQHGRNETARPCPRPRKRHRNEYHDTQIGIFFNRTFVLFHFAVQPSGYPRKKAETTVAHPTQQGADKQQNERNGQQIPSKSKQCGLPPRQSQSPPQRHRAAALDDGQHGTKEHAQLSADGIQKKIFNRLYHGLNPTTPYRALTSSSVSLAIINSSLVGITNILTLASGAEISTSAAPRIAFAFNSSSIFTPMNSKFLATRAR